MPLSTRSTSLMTGSCSISTSRTIPKRSPVKRCWVRVLWRMLHHIKILRHLSGDFLFCGGRGTGREQGARAIVYNSKRQDTTIMVIPCLCCCTTVRTCTGGGRYSGRPCFRVLYRPRQPNLQIVCSTAIQSSSAFRKEPFPQSLSSCA